MLPGLARPSMAVICAPKKGFEAKLFDVGLSILVEKCPKNVVESWPRLCRGKDQALKIPQKGKYTQCSHFERYGGSSSLLRCDCWRPSFPQRDLHPYPNDIEEAFQERQSKKLPQIGIDVQLFWTEKECAVENRVRGRGVFAQSRCEETNTIDFLFSGH